MNKNFHVAKIAVSWKDKSVSALSIIPGKKDEGRKGAITWPMRRQEGFVQ